MNVLNLATGRAGAVAAHFLALFGARVILVEPPEGSPLRRLGPFPNDIPDAEASGTFLHLARGQESLTVNRTRASGRQLLTTVAREMQLVIEDEGALDPWGVRAAIHEERKRRPQSPSSILSISPFGLTGPWAELHASDIVVFALSGLMATVGEPASAPLQLPDWLVQAYVGLSCFTAAATALWWQELTGTAHDLDVAALDVLATSNPHAISRYSYTGNVDRRHGSKFEQGYPWTLLPCKDGYIGVIVPERNWDVFCQWMGHPELISDPRFATRIARSRHVDELDEIMVAWTMEHTKEDLYREGQTRQLPFGAVFTLEDNLERDERGGRAFLGWLTNPQLGSLRQSGSPFMINGERLRLGAAPRLGEHTAQTLAELMGIDVPAALTRLRQEGLL